MQDRRRAGAATRGPAAGTETRDAVRRPMAVVHGGALIGGFLVFAAGSILVSPLVGAVGWAAFAAVVIGQARRGPMRRGRLPR